MLNHCVVHLKLMVYVNYNFDFKKWKENKKSFILPFPEFAAAAKSLQSWLTLCNPIDGSPLGFPVPGILQARTLEWVAISFSNVWKWKGKVKSLSRVWLLSTPWTAAYQASPPWDFPGKSTGVGCHCLLHAWIYMTTKLFYKCFLKTPWNLKF